MRHPLIVCRRAVQPLQTPVRQHVLVPEELFDLPVNKFFPPQCQYHKRHGSHVPGPLEARRRATKRRMTISAEFYPHDKYASPFNLRALLGFRRNTPPTWRYEPPTLPREAEILDSPLDFPSQPSPPPHLEPTTSTCSSSDHVPYTVAQDDQWSVELSRKEVEVDVESLAIISTPEQPVISANEFESCFRNFAAEITHVASLPTAERNRVVAKAFQSCCPSQPGAWRYGIKAIKHLVELDCDPVPIFRLASAFEIPAFITVEFQELLECLEQTYWRFPDIQPYCNQLCAKLAEVAIETDIPSQLSPDPKLIILVKQLWQSACSQGARAENSMNRILRALVTKLEDHKIGRTLQSMLANPNEADDAVISLIVCASSMEPWFPVAERVLACLPQERLDVYASSITLKLIQMIQRRVRFPKSTYRHRLSTWLELLHRIDTMSESRPSRMALLDLATAQISRLVFAFNTRTHTSLDLLLNALVIKLRHQNASRGMSVEKMFELIKYTSNLVADDIDQVKMVDLFATLFAHMKKESLPYQDLLEPFIALATQHASLNLVLRLLTAMDRQELTLRDFTIIDRLIAEKVSAIQIPKIPTTLPQRQRDAFALHMCREIFEILGKITRPPDASAPIITEDVLITLQSEQQFRHILHRAEVDHALPLACRNLSADMPIQQRVNLIHQLAYYYSLNITRSHLQNWRTIYFMYRHLEEHSLPIGSLFTKAVVRVSIIRPLIECRFVSARRLIWVCMLVARVEGEETAKRIEKDFWLWRGDLFLYAKRAYMLAGGDSTGKAHLGTMKRLKLV